MDSSGIHLHVLPIITVVLLLDRSVYSTVQTTGPNRQESLPHARQHTGRTPRQNAGPMSPR
jgi:hypothetical protein